MEDIKILEDVIQRRQQGLCYEQELTEKFYQAIKNLIKKNKELEEYKKYAELTKISCCTAQNCEALNNAIREGIENQKLREKIQTNYIPKSKVKAKIEEYRSKRIKLANYTYGYFWDNPDIVNLDTALFIAGEILQELLEY